MADTKWTKGKWSVVPPVNGDEISIISGCASDIELVAIISLFDEADFEEECANAHLISAAPDLYEALERLLANLAEGDFISETRIQSARNALSKARGE